MFLLKAVPAQGLGRRYKVYSAKSRTSCLLPVWNKMIFSSSFRLNKNTFKKKLSLACLEISYEVRRWLLPGPSRRLAPVIKCNAFLCFQSYIFRDISLTEVYRWLVTFGSVRWDLSLVQKFEVGSNNCNLVNIFSISLHTEWFNATIFTTYQ